MKFIVGNNILVQNPNEVLIKWAKENLVINNPDFIKKQKLGKWIGNTPRYIYLFERNLNELILPFGCLRELFTLFPDKTLFEAEFKPIEKHLYNSNIKLYDYQNNAVNEALRRKNGIIVMPCGSGKTQTALELVSKIGGKCLWLTHTKDLLNQSLNRAKACYNVPQSYLGTIVGGKVDIGVITFATVQTMCRLNLKQYKDVFDIVIVDECHKCVGSPTNVMQFYKVLTSLNCRYKYGLTATPKRADGLEKSMFALLGEKIIEISKEDVAKTTCPIEVDFVETGYMPNLDLVLSGDGTINYSCLIDDLTHDENRFDFVMNFINSIPENNPMLVLGNRVEYLEKLNNKFKGKSICLSGMSNNKKNRLERKESLKKLNNNELDCIFATYQLAKEGLDVPNLRYVVFATPEKDETTVTQSAGRVGREFKGKEKGVVIDFVDSFGMHRGWKKKRISIYKKLGFSLVD